MTAETFQDGAEWRQARKRVAEFIAYRDAHRARIDKVQSMMGRNPSNPVPDFIIAEYGRLDVNDLRVLVGQS